MFAIALVARALFPTTGTRRHDLTARRADDRQQTKHIVAATAAEDMLHVEGRHGWVLLQPPPRHGSRALAIESVASAAERTNLLLEALPHGLQVFQPLLFSRFMTSGRCVVRKSFLCDWADVVVCNIVKSCPHLSEEYRRGMLI